MKTGVVLGTILTLILIALSTGAFAQAAAEAALTNSISGAAAGNAAGSLGKGLGRALGETQQRLEKSTRDAPQSAPTKSAATHRSAGSVVATSSAGKSATFDIVVHGAETCSSAATTAVNQGGPDQANAKPGKCANQSSTANPKPNPKYPSVVQLPAQ
jgi:hypothetical protein